MAFQRISDKKKRLLFSCFKNDLTALQTSDFCNLNRNTVNRYFNLLGKEIFLESIREAEAEVGEHKPDESYFDARRIRGKRGRGAAGKTPVFGLLKRGDKVFVTIVPNCSKEALMPIIKGMALEKSTIHTDGWKAYDGLVVNGYDHYGVFH